MMRFSRWLLCLVVTLALCLPPRLHAMTAGGAAKAFAELAATTPTRHGDCHDGLAQQTGDGAYSACLIACASLPALCGLPEIQWRPGQSEKLLPRTALPSPATEPEALLRPPIALS